MFEIVGDITNVQVIATGRGIRRLKTLRKRHSATAFESRHLLCEGKWSPRREI
jgi:uncharacterized protein YcbK (DUF882 family)